MIRELIAGKPGEIDPDGFRIRGQDISRLEGLTDGVFALAMTLLIISVEVPQTFGDLMRMFKGLPVFAICFATIMWFWAEHHIISRRYGLTDKAMMWLNSILLFVILFYVYPLKFLFTLVISGMFYGTINTGTGVPMISDPQLPQLFLVYGIGFGSTALVFLLMHCHAMRQRGVLKFDDVEVVLVRGEQAKFSVLIAIAAASVIAAYTLPSRLLGFAGIIYSLIGVSEGVLSAVYGKKARLLRERLAAGPTRAE